MNKVLLIASGLSANQYKDYDYKSNGWTIVAINNGWQITNDWSHWIRPPDYKGMRPKALSRHQKIVERYSIQILKYGGQNACGFSITLTAGYWSLSELNPDVIGFLGADMNYTPDKNGKTHIYGVGHDIKANGISDPDRMVKVYGKNDPDYLKNIYMRFHDIAKDEGCAVYNFSTDENTRLPYTKAHPKDFDQ